MTERFDESRFRSTIAGMIFRHSGLRFTLQRAGSEIYNEISFEPDPKAVTVVKSHQPVTIVGFMEEHIEHDDFELFNQPLAKFYAFVDPERWYVVVKIHHCISDGRSMEIISSEIVDQYRSAVIDCRPNPLAAYQFDSHIVSAHLRYMRGELQDDISYWSSILDRCKPPSRQISASRYGLVHIRTSFLPESLYLVALKGARVMRVSFFCYFMHAFAVALDQVLSGIPSSLETTFSGRLREEMDTCIGYFSHNAIIATDFLRRTERRCQIAALGKQLLESLSAQEIPVGYLFVKHKLKPEIPFPNRRFRIKLQMQNFRKNVPLSKMPKISDTTTETSTTSARALRLFLVPYEDGIGLRAEYRSDIFTSRNIDELLASTVSELVNTNA